MNWLGEAGLAIAIGVVSALLPLVNAEAYVLIAVARTNVALSMGVALAMAVGQTLGKLLLFEAARRGTGRARLARHGKGRAERWRGRVCGLMSRRRTGLPTVLASATVGLPPLALVSLAAGASAQKRCEFGVVCLVGRTARFAALALPAALALR